MFIPGITTFEVERNLKLELKKFGLFLCPIDFFILNDIILTEFFVMIFQVTPDKAFLLFQARFVIDGPFEDREGLWKEAKKFATREDHVAYVFMKEGAPVGYVEVKLHEDQAPTGSPPLPILNSLGHIARVGVHQDYRRGGIGTRLLAAAENWLVSANSPGMWLCYLTENEPAAITYTKFGFGDFVEFKDPSTDPPRMRKIAGKMW